MKQLGVWIDKNEAKIISLKNGTQQIVTIPSNIEDYHVTGGSGTRLKGGPQDVVQDRKYLEREKHQIKMFFDEIIPKLMSSDSIVLFGPAQMAQKLYKKISETHSKLYHRIQSVEKADSMTEKQQIAWVKSYYKIKSK